MYKSMYCYTIHPYNNANKCYYIFVLALVQANPIQFIQKLIPIALMAEKCRQIIIKA